MDKDVMIRVEGVSKRYTLGANQTNERYQSLRDVVAERARALFRRPARRPAAAESETDFWALRDVSFEVGRGEVVGIIGRNGAGKSTLLKVLSRITEPSAGRVRLRGRVASLLEVGTGFHPELTGRENIYLNGAILGMHRQEIRAKFAEIVAFAEVERFLDTPVKRYSSGMYVRLAFAVAAHLEPEILIVDEVLAVGDAEFQKKCLGKMQQVSQSEGRTVLFVSHNMAAVRTLCTKGIMLQKGEVVSFGDMGEALDSYAGTVSSEREVVFAPRQNQPTITRVMVDQEELKLGNLTVDIDFCSPFNLLPPIPGIVISTPQGVPVYGSNPRFHEAALPKAGATRGTMRLSAYALPLRNANYRISVWLGDWHNDYDHRSEVLSFDFVAPSNGGPTPDASAVGYVNWPGKWACLES